MLEQSGLDVPLIVVSGTIGEERAVELMRAGASDYLMKGNLARLAPAVEREVKEAEGRGHRRQAERDARDLTASWRRPTTPSWPTWTEITTWNAGAERLYGWAAAEIVGRPLSPLVPPDPPEEMAGRPGRCLGERVELSETSGCGRTGRG